MKVDEAGLAIRPWGLNKSVDGLNGMNEDVAFMVRRAAYIDEIRAVALRARRMGWAALLLGIGTIAWAALRGPGVHSRPAHWGEAAILLAWALFFYAMIRRTRYVRTHPFHPNDHG